MASLFQQRIRAAWPSDLNFKFARRVADALEDLGAQVLLTRQRDDTHDLPTDTGSLYGPSASVIQQTLP
jgi:hypothetical protein